MELVGHDDVEGSGFGRRELRQVLAAEAELARAVSAHTQHALISCQGSHGAANLAVSDIRVFGNGAGARPPTPRGLTARRNRDERNASIAWQAAPGAVGYNVRWGSSPTKLYETYQRFSDQGTTLELRALTVGQPYWIAIESFDENGVSALSPVVEVR